MNVALSRYSKGRAKEYKVMSILRDEGWLVTRSAASHGPIDIIAAKDGKIKLIQVKSGSSRIRKCEISELVKWGENFGCDVEIWHFKKRGILEQKKIYTAV